MQPNEQPRSGNLQLINELLLALLLIGLPIFLFYGNGDVENDEAIYSFAAERIVETGEWLTPVDIYFGNPPFLEKPPLKFWITALGLEMGLPQNTWGLRFADVVLTVLTFGYLIAIGYKVGGRWAGLLSGIVFFAFSDPLLQHGLLSNNTESAVLLQYTGATYHFMAWVEGTRRRVLHAVAIGLYFVLGFLSKFVAALFMPVILAVVLVVHRDLLRRFWIDIALWLCVGVMVSVLIAPWFIYQHFQHGEVFWETIVGVHVVERMTGFLDPAHLLPWYFYLHLTARVLIEGGAGLAYLIGFWFVVKIYSTNRDPKITTLFAWYLVPVIAISAMTSKITHYIYPFLPPVAVVCGLGLAHLSRLSLPALGDYRIGYWASRISDRLAAIPVQRIILTVALVPILVVYTQTILEMRSRPSQFRDLIACLQELGVTPPLPAFFEPHRSANHIFTYYNLARDEGIDPQHLIRFLFGDRPEAVWLTEAMHRDFVVSDTRVHSIDAIWMPLAKLRSGEGRLEPIYLLLPGEYAACSPKLQQAGSVRVDPARYFQ